MIKVFLQLFIRQGSEMIPVSWMKKHATERQSKTISLSDSSWILSHLHHFFIFIIIIVTTINLLANQFILWSRPLVNFEHHHHLYLLPLGLSENLPSRTSFLCTVLNKYYNFIFRPLLGSPTSSWNIPKFSGPCSELIWTLCWQSSHRTRELFLFDSSPFFLKRITCLY